MRSACVVELNVTVSVVKILSVCHKGYGKYVSPTTIKPS